MKWSDFQCAVGGRRNSLPSSITSLKVRDSLKLLCLTTLFEGGVEALNFYHLAVVVVVNVVEKNPLLQVVCHFFSGRLAGWELLCFEMRLILAAIHLCNKASGWATLLNVF